jgi:hypothetical protein
LTQDNKEPPQGRKLSFAITLPIIGFVAVPAYMRAPDTDLYGWLDFTALGLFCLLLAWLTSDGPRSAEGRADQGFALRLGKACNRALKRCKGLWRSTSAD